MNAATSTTAPAATAARPGAERLSLASLAASYFMLGTGSLAVIGLLDPLAAELHVARTDVAQLVTVFALTFAVAAPLLQIVLGHLPRRTLLLCGLVVLAAGSLMSAIASTFATAVAARVVTALGAAAVGPVASALGAGLVAPQQQARALATVFGGMTIASVIGVPLCAWVGHALSWQAVFAALAVLALLCACSVARTIADRSPGTPLTARSLAQVVQRPATRWAITTTLLQMAAQFASYALVAVLLAERFHVAAAAVSGALLVFGIGGIAGNVLAGRLADRMDTDRLLWAALGGLLAVFAAMAAAPYSAATGIALLFAWAIVGMLFQAPQQRRLIGVAPELRGLLLAMNASSLYLGMSLGAFAGKQAYEAWGAPGLLAASIALAALAASAFALSRRAVRRTAGQSH